jgi:hypothetical protein
LQSLARVLVLIGLILGLVTPLRGESNYSVLNLGRISPPTLQAESMRSDALHGRPLYQVATGDLWISGENHLWRWNLASSAVTRFELPAKLHRPIKLAAFDGGEILGFDRERLWTLDYQSKTWRSLDIGLEAGCPTLPATFARAAKPLLQFLLGKCGGYLVDLKGKTPRVFSFAQALVDDVFSMAGGEDKAGEFVLFTQNRAIFRQHLNNGKAALEKVYSSKSDLKGIVGGDGVFYAWTGKAILVFDRNMRRQKVIPVVGQRRLAAFGVTPEFHALVFDDGTLELMGIKSKKKWYSLQPLKFAQYVDFIDDGKYLMVSAETGQPQVFRVTIAD